MIRHLVPLSAVAFVLNAIWEIAQASLFQGYVSFAQHVPVCLWAIVGDVVIVLSVYALVGLFKNDSLWIAHYRMQDAFGLAIVGFFVALWIEHRALLFGKWAYAAAMPIIPYFSVGLAPIAQMVLLLPLSVLIVKKFVSSN